MGGAAPLLLFSLGPFSIAPILGFLKEKIMDPLSISNPLFLNDGGERERGGGAHSNSDAKQWIQLSMSISLFSAGGGGRQYCYFLWVHVLFPQY